jgi:hypothetical protein
LLETLSQLSDDEDENEDEPVLAGYAQDPYTDSQDPYEDYADLALWRLYESEDFLKNHLWAILELWRLYESEDFLKKDTLWQLYYDIKTFWIIVRIHVSADTKDKIINFAQETVQALLLLSVSTEDPRIIGALLFRRHAEHWIIAVQNYYFYCLEDMPNIFYCLYL